MRQASISSSEPRGGGGSAFLLKRGKGGRCAALLGHVFRLHPTHMGGRKTNTPPCPSLPPTNPKHLSPPLLLHQPTHPSLSLCLPIRIAKAVLYERMTYDETTNTCHCVPLPQVTEETPKNLSPPSTPRPSMDLSRQSTQQQGQLQQQQGATGAGAARWEGQGGSRCCCSVGLLPDPRRASQHLSPKKN